MQLNSLSRKTLSLVCAIAVGVGAWSQTASATEISGNIIHDGSGTGLYHVWALHASALPIAGIDVQPLPGPFDIPILSDGNYFLFSWKDLNGDTMPSTSEPLGWLGTPFPMPVTVSNGHDVNNVNIPLLFHSFQTQLRGRVLYTGTQTGRIWIVPHLSPLFDISEIAGTPWTVNGVGQEFRSFVFFPGLYFISSFMDVNGNMLIDPGEPVGTHFGPIMVTVGGQLIDNLDIMLIDSAVSVEQSTWSQVKELYSR